MVKSTFLSTLQEGFCTQLKVIFTYLLTNYFSESDIEKYFRQYGNVVDVAIMRDKHTGKSRGFAFVTFREKSKEGVKILTQSLLKPPTPHIIQNRVIEVREGDGSKPPDSFLDKSAPPVKDRDRSSRTHQSSGSSHQPHSNRGDHH